MANGPRKPMRQGQQNRRGRGRGRKSQNPLSRNLESNGPEVKIRGNAAHIAEKYATLARDAYVAGDIVAGQSYLQHAEHYNRIIMANQAQQAVAHGDGANGADVANDRQNGRDEGPEGKQPDVVAEDNRASVSGRNTAPKKPANRSAASGNGADGADEVKSVAEANKEDASDGSDPDEKPDEAVT
jgi:hypothetical protein